MRTRAVVVLTVALAAALWASSSASADSIFSVPGYHAKGTPAKYDKVMVRRYGSPSAKNVLVLVPGTFAGASDFAIVGPYLAKHVPSLQVWAEDRREGALEDDSMLIKGVKGQATVQQVFNFYTGWLADKTISPHYQPLDASKFGFVKRWGLKVAMEDLHRVILKARAGGRRKVILGGHSLGGGEAATYPVWDFNGHGGYEDIAGIVGIDGGAISGGTNSVNTVADAKKALAGIDAKGPFSDLLGFGLPWVTGPLAEVGALSAIREPHALSIAGSFPLLPPSLKPPVPATNAAQFGYAFDASTSPAALALIHVHSGHINNANPADWVDDGPTPLGNLAKAASVEPLGFVDWYFPARLSVDAGAGRGLKATAVTKFLGLDLGHLKQVNVPYYVIETSLGGAGNALGKGAKFYKSQSHIPSIRVVDTSKIYSHLDPLLATPSKNRFLETVVPWLKRVTG
jgi:hypothetical protein